MTFNGRIEAAIVVPAGVSIKATNSGGGPTSVPIVAGTYFLSGSTNPGLISHLQTQLNTIRTPANWTVSLSIGANGTGQVTINWTGSGTYTIDWTASAGGQILRNILGYAGNLTGVTQGVPSVGILQAKALWIPDCPVMCDLDPQRAPQVSDKRTSIGPRGDAYTIVGTVRFRHPNVRYTHVAVSRIWEHRATLTNASWETFHTDTQQAMPIGFDTGGWFLPGSPVVIYDINGIPFGSDAVGGSGLTNGWSFEALPELDQLKQVTPGWTGMWTVNLGALVSSG